MSIAKTAEIQVKVSAKMDVDERTAEMSLQLVEMYLNANPDISLVASTDRDERGKIIALRFEREDG